MDKIELKKLLLAMTDKIDDVVLARAVGVVIDVDIQSGVIRVEVGVERNENYEKTLPN